MPKEPQSHRVEVTFVGRPPDRQIARASGVVEVEIKDSHLSCVILGSFQPFLDALRGYEVISITSIPTTAGGD